MGEIKLFFMTMARKTTATAVTLCLLSLAAASLTAQQSASPKPPTAKPTPTAQEEEEGSAPAPQKPGVEGLKIHGHWILNVKDVNGKVVEHRDFQNSLTLLGTTTLSLLTYGQAASAGLVIKATEGSTQLYQISPNSMTAFSVQRPCVYDQNLPDGIIENCVKGLVQTVTLPVVPAGCVQNACATFATIGLSGSFVAVAPINVDTLTTSNYLCKSARPFTPYTQSAAACAAQGTLLGGNAQIYDFTGTTITPLSIGTGQTLEINVTLSFS